MIKKNNWPPRPKNQKKAIVYDTGFILDDIRIRVNSYNERQEESAIDRNKMEINGVPLAQLEAMKMQERILNDPFLKALSNRKLEIIESMPIKGIIKDGKYESLPCESDELDEIDRLYKERMNQLLSKKPLI